MSGSKTDSLQTEVAYFGGGPFWCMEAIFRRVPGILSIATGYAGGNTKNPTYIQVCEGNTGHCEVIKVDFDVTKIFYHNLLKVFWEAHNPTRFNSVFEIGSQYRSAIFYVTESQKETAALSKMQAQKNFPHPIVTEIAPFKNFYKADDRHQNYYGNNADAPYCQVIIAPRLQALESRGILPKKSETEFFNRPKAA